MKNAPIGIALKKFPKLNYNDSKIVNVQEKLCHTLS